MSSLEKSKRQFTRTSSFHKMQELNRYICSKHYFVFATLACWLKMSLTALRTGMLVLEFLGRILAKVKRNLCFEKDYYLLVRLGVLLIYLQFGCCVYFLFGVCIPMGLVFLMVSLYLIGVVYVGLAVSYVKREEGKSSGRTFN